MPIAILLFLFSSIQVSCGVSINNGLTNGPNIECGPGSVRIGFLTQNNFYGRIFVQGNSRDERCRRKGDGIQKSISIDLPFEHCNLARIRSLSPRGIYVTTTIVISFHPYFLTKTDIAYRIQCSYLEAEKFVTANLDVKNPYNLPQLQVPPPMPSCHYEILENGIDGNPITFATIGSQVYHKWTCDSTLKNTYCMIVHSCIVDDGTGDKIPILDDQGCAIDNFLLSNLEYPTDLMAGKEAHVYKYADREMLFFECRISVSLKNKNEACPRPKCIEPKGFGNSSKTKSKRQDMKKRSVHENVVDVRTELYAVDLPRVQKMPDGILRSIEMEDGNAAKRMQIREKLDFTVNRDTISHVTLMIIICLLLVIYVTCFYRSYFD